MFSWLFGKKKVEAVAVEEEKKDEPRGSLFSTHDGGGIPRASVPIKDRIAGLQKIAPKPIPLPVSADGSVAAMDEDDTGFAEVMKGYGRNQPNLSDAVAMWYSSQTFIGHQLAGILAQHWLIAKACDMPGRDALRNGFTTVSVTGEAIPENVLQKIKDGDKRYKLKKNLREFVYFGRVFGIRICIFKVRTNDPEYYEKPFNIDGVAPGSYLGMVQVDPYWCSPELDAKASSQPDTMHFYEPTFWLINGKRYHRSHLVIYRHGMVADILKPAYIYGGIPVPQLIMERVYGAERTANEAPLMALTKRTVVYKTNIAKFFANISKGVQRLREMSELWNNHGVRVIDKEADEHEQHETSLADFDTTIMTQYQLVAAGAEVPGTKLLGTAPKGFNATGEFDESSYHESLESLREHDITPFVERHQQMMIKSDIPEAAGISTTPSWEPLDSPTAAEWAEINFKISQTALNNVTMGATDGNDERVRLASDKNSGYQSLVVNKPIDESKTATAIKAGVSPLGSATVEAQK